MIGIYCPTLSRPQKMRQLVDNLQATTRSPFQLYWGVEPDDRESILAAKDTGYPVIINEGKPSYSDALQTIYEQTDEPIFLWANDDFHFLDGWDIVPLEMMEKHEDIGVLGLYDGNPKTSFTSISLIRRKYIEEQSGVVDMPNRVLYPYKHNYVDNELTETAQHRGVWDRCETPCIEHQHPSFKWLGDFPSDATYEKNLKTFGQDSETFNNRRHLWS